MTKNKTTGVVLKGLAIAAGLVTLGVATQASATQEIKLLSDSMDTHYTANITLNGHTVDAYSNGVTFTTQDWNPAANGGHGAVYGSTFQLYGFCVDITHEISLGNLSGQNLIYNDNEDPAIVDPLPTDFDGDTITPTQLNRLTNLIDTGYLLHQSETGQSSAYVSNVELQLAAIQAAIWKVENTDATITVNSGTTKAGTTSYGGAIAGAGLTYQQYFNDYATGNYHSLADANDKFYTIVEQSPHVDGNQAFAIGWPIPGVPEPATWAMMLVGFGGLGGMLRLRRRQAALLA